MRTLILTEGGNQIGLGHISRCSSLYDELESRGMEVEFIIYSTAINIEMLENKKHTIVNWKSKEFLEGNIGENDYCIVDSYLASEDLCRTVSTLAKKTVFIDDNARINYHAGIIVNPSLSTKSVNYSLNNSNCFLLGPDYIILRKPFVQVNRPSINTEIKDVLITLGGSDIHNLTPIILNQFQNRYSNISFNIVSGQVDNNVKFLKEIYFDNVNYFENVTAEEMKDIMLKSDIAITAAGQTIHELIATKTPFIPIQIAKNQDNNVAGLIEHGLIDKVIEYDDELFKEKIVAEFENLMDSCSRKRLVNRYSRVIDGLGSKRIVNSLILGDLIGSNYFLRKISKDDIHDVFLLSNEDYVREFSISKSKIAWEEHAVWFENILNSSNNIFYVITDFDNNFLGQLRYKIEDNCAVVSISLCKSITGKGFSSKFLKQSLNLIRDERKNLKNIIAYVSERNIASKKLFEKVGFLLKENKKGMLKYIYSIN